MGSGVGRKELGAQGVRGSLIKGTHDTGKRWSFFPRNSSAAMYRVCTRGGGKWDRMRESETAKTTISSAQAISK